MLRRCLEKDVAIRLRDIADARLDIVDALAPHVENQPPVEGRRRVSLGVLAIAAMAFAVGGVYVIGRDSPPASPGVVSRLTFRQGNVGKARFAPDGQTIIYSASWDGEPFRLYSTRLGSMQSRSIDLPAGDLLAVSRQGQVAVSMGRPAVDGFEPSGTLAVTALAGGAPRELYPDIIGADWTPDGATMAIARRVGDRARLEFPVGTTVHEAITVLPPRISPDGQRACFFAGAAYGELMVAERGGSARRLSAGLNRGGHCAWTPDGREIWVESGGAAMHYSLEAFDLEGRRRTLGSYSGMIQIEDISPDGKVLVTAGTLRFSTHGGTDADTERDLSVFDATRAYHLSAAGRALLLWDNSPGALADRVFLRTMDAAPPVALGPGAPAAISPDGQWVAVIGNGKTNERIRNQLTLFPTGAGSARTIDLPIDIEPLFAGAQGRTDWIRRAYEFAADGNRLLIPFGRAMNRRPRVYVYDFTRKAAIPVTPEGITGAAVLAPDGRAVAVNEGGHVVVRTVDDSRQQEMAGPPETGMVAAWSGDGKALFVIEQADAVARVFRRELATGRRALVREIRAQSPAGLTAFDVLVSRDGRAYAYTKSVRLANVFVIEGLR